MRTDRPRQLVAAVFGIPRRLLDHLIETARRSTVKVETQLKSKPLVPKLLPEAGAPNLRDIAR